MRTRQKRFMGISACHHCDSTTCREIRQSGIADRPDVMRFCDSWQSMEQRRSTHGLKLLPFRPIQNRCAVPSVAGNYTSAQTSTTGHRMSLVSNARHAAKNGNPMAQSKPDVLPTNVRHIYTGGLFRCCIAFLSTDTEASKEGDVRRCPKCLGEMHVKNGVWRWKYDGPANTSK